MRRISISIALLLLLVAPTTAEVCDKIAGEQWRPGDETVGTYAMSAFLLKRLPRPLEAK